MEALEAALLLFPAILSFGNWDTATGICQCEMDNIFRQYNFL
jgi:hypothetical protein